MTRSLAVGELGYTLFSDSDLDAARAFGIAFQLKPLDGAYEMNP